MRSSGSFSYLLLCCFQAIDFASNSGRQNGIGLKPCGWYTVWLKDPCVTHLSDVQDKILLTSGVYDGPTVVLRKLPLLVYSPSP